MRILDEITYQNILGGGVGSGVYDHSKFNTLDRLDKLKSKESSLRKLGLHKEADLFKLKIGELKPKPSDEEVFSKIAKAGYVLSTKNPGVKVFHGKYGTRLHIHDDGKWESYAPNGASESGADLDSLSKHIYRGF